MRERRLLVWLTHCKTNRKIAAKLALHYFGKYPKSGGAFVVTGSAAG
jgi:hypothetical protein